MIPLKKPLPGIETEQQLPHEPINIPQQKPSIQQPTQSAATNTTVDENASPLPATNKNRRLVKLIVILLLVIALAVGVYFLFIKGNKSSWNDNVDWSTENVEIFNDDF